MKKHICALLALVMVLLCAGCGESKEPPSGIYYDITGIAPDETVMEVDGNAVPAELYFYWMMYNCSSVDYQILSANSYYGIYGELLNEDSTLNWDALLSDGMTVGQFALQQAEDTIALYATIENMAEEYGVEVSDEDAAAMEANRAAAVEELGGEEAFQDYLAQLGITEETFTRLSLASSLLDGLAALVLEEGSPLYLEEADYDQYAVYADHILLSTIDTTTGAALSEEEIAAKLATANDLLAQLRAAADPEALFAQLADQYSDDTGRATNPTGYIYTPGTMVEIFEDTAAALAPGEISDVIESDYGYHIILRKDLSQGFVDYPDQKQAIAQEHLDSILKLRMQEAAVTRSEKLDALDPGVFYTDYMSRIEAMNAAEEEEDALSDDAAGETGADNDSAASAGNNAEESSGGSGQ